MFGIETETYPANIYLLKVDSKNTRKRLEIFSKLTIKTPERRHRSGVFIVNFEHISHLFLVLLLLTLNKKMLAEYIPVKDKQVDPNGNNHFHI